MQVCMIFNLMRLCLYWVFSNEQVKHLNPRELLRQWGTQEELEDICYGCKQSGPSSPPSCEQLQKLRLGNLSSGRIWPKWPNYAMYVHVSAGFGAEPV